MWLKRLWGVIALSTITMTIAPGAITLKAMADEVELEETRLYGIPAEVLRDQAFRTSPDGFEAFTLKEQWRVMFGTGENKPIGRGQYPEIAIERDLAYVNAFWQDMMVQQTMGDPTIRVPDVVNPFNTSLMLMPSSQFNSRVLGSEFVYERLQ
jgi:hypothetical protein